MRPKCLYLEQRHYKISLMKLSSEYFETHQGASTNVMISLIGVRDMEEQNKTLEAILERAVDLVLRLTQRSASLSRGDKVLYGHKYTKKGSMLNPEKNQSCSRKQPTKIKRNCEKLFWYDRIPIKVHPKIRIANLTLAKADSQKHKVQMGSRRNCSI